MDPEWILSGGQNLSCNSNKNFSIRFGGCKYLDWTGKIQWLQCVYIHSMGLWLLRHAVAMEGFKYSKIQASNECERIGLTGVTSSSHQPFNEDQVLKL